MKKLPDLPKSLYEEYPVMSAHAHEVAVKEYAQSAMSAIAPPVAAGSVDTDHFKFLCHSYYASTGTQQVGRRLAIVEWLDAWGAQQREAGRQGGMQTNENAYQAVIETVRVVAERAEKAEAELAESAMAQAELQEKFDKQGAQFCVTALKLRDAESRLRPMEACFRMMRLEIPDPLSQPIDPSDTPC